VEKILARGNPPPEDLRGGMKAAARKLEDLDTGRLADLDYNGISVQVLSWVGPGADLLDGVHGAEFAREANDRLAEDVLIALPALRIF
jgi:uncharacterized protein